MTTSLSEHFTREELQCRCGCGLCSPGAGLITLAEDIRALLNAPMIVHSACRCAPHNARVGGAPNSRHLQGRAMDFHAPGISAADVFKRIKAERDAGRLPLLGGLGLYDWGVHIDTRSTADGQLRTWDCRRAK